MCVCLTSHQKEAERKRRMEAEVERLETNRKKEREERRKQREDQMKKELEEFNAKEEERKRRREERERARNDEKQRAAQELAQKESEKKRIADERAAAQREKLEKRKQYLEKVAKQKENFIKDRVVKSVPVVENLVLDFDDVFEERLSDSKLVPKYDLLKNHFYREGRIESSVALEICKRAKAILQTEPNVLKLKAPIVVFGDLHGQYYDLLNMMSAAGPVDDTQYLFLGDYVDRGCFSIEVVLYLLSIKICYPTTFWMLRGNHESRGITEFFNFKAECSYKYGLDLYDELMETFDALPLAATVEAPDLPGTFFCCHGGLGPDIKNIEELQSINRFMEPPEDGAFADLLWSDPIEDGSAVGLSNAEMEDWWKVDYSPNTARGTSCMYYYHAALEFCNRNNIVSVIRAHEVQKFGYLEHRFRRKDREYPLVITIFSAPNYCDMYENRGAFMKISEREYDFVQCPWVEHPYYLPDFQNVFKFSLTFLAENVTRFALNILDLCNQAEDESDSGEAGSESGEEIEEEMQEKIQNLSKTMVMLSAMRMAKENSLKPVSILEERYNENLSLFEQIVAADELEKKKPSTVIEPKKREDPRAKFTKIKSSPSLIAGKSGSRILPPRAPLTRQHSTGHL
eukprot:TRINITY_DN9459_c0_g1_i1.p1 TRINITY_DN9459_c0_g1~~TRINITY_DN9459_c0_g1_i1.p1  ORF type:complete len:630 (-),score=179.70 TRINITY_DN9459_c0_g1_i1:48-1937(-)